MPGLLALDSSTEVLAIALIHAGETLTYEAEGGAQASSQLVPQAMQLLERAGLALAELDAIAFGAGPGAFTGLRTACAVAQGLAFGAGKPVLALDSLLLVAEDARQQAESSDQALQGPIWVAMDARMNEIYAAAYQWDGRGWQCLVNPALYSLEALQARWAEDAPQALAGSALEPFGLTNQAARHWPRTDSRARALGALAAQAWGRGDLIDAAEAMPVYIRDKVALTTAEREAARAAAEGA